MAPEHQKDMPPLGAWRGGTGDSRVTSSVMLVAMTVVLALSLSVPLAAPPIWEDAHNRASGGEVVSVKQDVKIVAASPALEAPCEEQTWPYLDKRCLKGMQAQAPKITQREASRQSARQDGTAGDAFDPRSAVPVVIRPPGAGEPQANAGTTGAGVDDSDAATSTRPVENNAMAAAAVTAGAAAAAALAKPEEEQPAAVPTEPSEAREERKTRRSQRKSDPQRIVRRWRELVYDLPGGGMRRLKIFPRGMF